MAIITPYQRISAQEFHQVFKAGAEDVVLTVEFKNLNHNRVKLRAQLYGNQEKPLGIPFNLEVPENKSYKKFNVLVQAGKSLYVKCEEPGFAVRVYQAGLYSKPGQVQLDNGDSGTIQLFLDADGVHTVKLKTSALPQGITVDKTEATIQQGVPAAFTFTRDANSRAIGAAFFSIETLKIGTAIDIDTEAIIDDGTGSGSGSNDPDVDVDMVSAYIFGRDSVTH